MGLSLEVLKWICAFIVAILTFIGTLLPLCIKTETWTSRFESLAGGVFLGAGFAHLFEDSTNEIAQYGKISYPISGAIAVSTFVILTAIEILSYSERDMKDHKHLYSDHSDHPDTDQIHHDLNDIESDQQSNTIGKQVKEKNKSHGFFRSKFKLLSIPATSIYIIMLVHSIIEGLALGIMNSTSGVIALTCAVGGHKPVEGFALGLFILKSGPTKWLFWIMMIVYVLMSPGGIIVAIFLSKGGNLLTLGILSAISTGTFTFVGMDEWSDIFFHKSTWSLREKLWHLGLFALGVVWMLLMAIPQ